MTAIATDNQLGIRRCAVCKIDRKGRFILADDGAQKLLGHTEVELFGRPLTDFLDPADHTTVEAMTSNRNPYETVFDAATVTLLDHKRNRTIATLIISVNFGGGNPANYQVIMYPEGPPALSDVHRSSRPWAEYLDYLTQNDQIEEPERLAQCLKDLTSVPAAAIYETGAGETSLLACVSSDTQMGESITPAEAPADSELRATFGLADGRLGLAVLTLDESDPESSLVREQAELAAVLLHSLCPPMTDQADDSDGRVMTTTAGRLLNQLGIGTVALDPAGQILEQNPAFNNLFETRPEVDTVFDLIELIGESGDRAAAAAIRAYFDASSAGESAPRLHLEIRLRSVGPVALTFERLKPGTDDLSGCFLLSGNDHPAAVGRQSPRMPVGLSLAVADQLRASLVAAQSVWRKLEHEHHDELKNDGNFYIQCLSHHLLAVDRTLSDLEQILKLVGADEKPQVVDLGLAVDDASADLESNRSDLSLTVKHSNLPKVRTYLGKLAAVLSYVFEAAAARADGNQLELQVSATAVDGTCTVWVRDDGPKLTKKQSRRAFDYVAPEISGNDRVGSSRPAGLAQARTLLQSYGGRIELESASDTGVGVMIRFPELPK